jgi:hypothetical protein
MALEELGRMGEARSNYVIAAGLGFKGGDFQLRRLDAIKSIGDRAQSELSGKPE